MSVGRRCTTPPRRFSAFGPRQRIWPTALMCPFRICSFKATSLACGRPSKGLQQTGGKARVLKCRLFRFYFTSKTTIVAVLPTRPANRFVRRRTAKNAPTSDPLD